MYYFSDDWARRRTGRHRTTIARWRAQRRFPPELVRLARLELDGELGIICPAFEGFRLCRRRGVLIVPYAAAPQYGSADTEYTPGELCALPWRLALVKDLERAAS